MDTINNDRVRKNVVIPLKRDRLVLLEAAENAFILFNVDDLTQRNELFALASTLNDQLKRLEENEK